MMDKTRLDRSLGKTSVKLGRARKRVLRVSYGAGLADDPPGLIKFYETRKTTHFLPSASGVLLRSIARAFPNDMERSPSSMD